MDLVTEPQCDTASDHLRTCETCKEASREINSASVKIESWAAAIEEFADEARETDDSDRCETLLAAVSGLAWAIWRVASTDITGETLSAKGRHRASPRLVPFGSPDSPTS
jgi:hypothetical protein